MRRRLFKRVMVLLLLLAAGAIVNVAVAWGGALMWRAPQMPGAFLMERPGMHEWPAAVPSHWPTPPRALGLEKALWSNARYMVRENEFTDHRRILKTEVFLIDHYCFGWPLRSLRSEIWEEFMIKGDPSVLTRRFDGHPEPTVWSWGLETGIGVGTVPLHAIWPGFAINTLFYAVMLWMMFAFPFKARRWRRRKRGLCPACAYPIGTSEVCTECGKPLPAVTPRVSVK